MFFSALECYVAMVFIQYIFIIGNCIYCISIANLYCICDMLHTINCKLQFALFFKTSVLLIEWTAQLFC